MARPKARDEKAAREGGPRRDKASREEAKLRAYHALGRKALKRIKDGRLDADTLRRLSAETGYGFDAIKKARVFAKVYNKGQLDALCGLRTPEGMPLSWRHVRQLLMLPPGEARDAFQRKAAEKGWSLEELIAAIPQKVRRKQSRRESGRPFRGPTTVADGLRQVVRHGEAWLRRYRKAWEDFDWRSGTPGAAGRGGLGARVAEARETLKALREAARRLDDRLKRLEREQARG